MTSAQQAVDGVMPGARVEVAQVSSRFGAGPFATLELF